MPQWSSTPNNANSAPYWNMRNAISGSIPTGNTTVAYGNTLYGNSTVGTWLPTAAVGVFGVSDLQARASESVTHAGWVKVIRGTGPVAEMRVNLAGANWANGNIVTVSNGITNAVGTVVTNNTGNVSSITITSGGSGFVNASAAVVAFSNSTGGTTGNGQGASVTLTFGGRAGRVQTETLVAMGSLANGGISSPYFDNI